MSQNNNGKKTKVKVYDANDIKKLNEVRLKNPNSKIIMESSKEPTKIIKSDSAKIKNNDQGSTIASYKWSLIFLILLGISVGFLIYSIIIDHSANIVISISFIAWFLALTLSTAYAKRKQLQSGQKPERINKWSNYKPETKRSFIINGLGIALMIVLGIISYIMSYDMKIISWFVIGIGEVLMVFHIIDTIKVEEQRFMELPPDIKKQKRINGNYFRKSNFIFQNVIFMILIFFAVNLLLGNDVIGDFNQLLGIELDDYNSLNATFGLCMILVALSAVYQITQTKRSPQLNTDYDRTGYIHVIMEVILVLLVLWFVPSTSANIEGMIIEGALGDYNWFNSIYLSILTSRYTQFSLVLIMISALTILVGKARGQRGSSTMVAGALGVAGIPMIITIMAFVGQIPAPPQFYTLFGEGFAELIFAISYTCVISLALALVGVFYEIVPSAVVGNLDND